MKYRTQTLLALAIAGLVALPGCSTSSDTTVDSNEQARDASASGTQSANLASNSGNLLFTGSEAGLVAVPTGSPAPSTPRLKTFSGSTSDQFTKIAALRNPAVATKTKNVVNRSVSRAQSLAKSMARATVTINETAACVDGGTYTATGTWDDVAKTFSLTVVFSACREEGHELNGPVAFTGSHDEITRTFTGSATAGDGDGVLEPTEDLFARKYEELGGDPYGLEVANLVEDLTHTFTFINTSNPPNVESADFDMSANGALRYTDVDSGNSATITYTNLSFVGDHSYDNGGTPGDLPADVADDVEDTLVTTNGGISLDAPLIDIDINYTDFRLTEHETNNYEEYTIDGTVTTDFTPDVCNEGTFSFVTNIPVRENNFGTTIAGEVVINGNVTVVFNPDGTVTVTVAGSDPVTYESWEDLENQPGSCPIPDFE
ncbi:MAG: hypothetical protein BMS9Abin36_2171 [Gammaproteobacteria bacterium]|nr:MAG: hypothetical protein BMS9Abin36_2171 [Gammaproteobacteria bacterium]